MKREVTMCDKPGCTVTAAGQCALCDQDVCVTHAEQASLAYKGADGEFPQLPLPLFICHQCGTATMVKSGGHDAVDYVVQSWPPEAAAALKPLITVLRAAMAACALRGTAPPTPPWLGVATAAMTKSISGFGSGIIGHQQMSLQQPMPPPPSRCHYCGNICRGASNTVCVSCLESRCAICTRKGSADAPFAHDQPLTPFVRSPTDGRIAAYACKEGTGCRV